MLTLPQRSVVCSASQDLLPALISLSIVGESSPGAFLPQDAIALEECTSKQTCLLTRQLRTGRESGSRKCRKPGERDKGGRRGAQGFLRWICIVGG